MRSIYLVRFVLLIGIVVWFVFAVSKEGWGRTQRKIVGGVVGGLAGFFIPFIIAAIYVALGGDQTAAGVFSFFGILTVPVGIAAGVATGSRDTTVGKQKPRNGSRPTTLSVVRTVRSAVEAEMFIKCLRNAGLHPTEVDTAAYFSLAGADTELPIEVPTKELAPAQELLKAYESASPSA